VGYGGECGDVSFLVLAETAARPTNFAVGATMTKNAFVELERGSAGIFPEEEFRARLLNASRKRRPQRIKAGFDPTARGLHLGHALLLDRMRAFQDAGHEVTFLIGDFTASIGDPSAITREPLGREQVEANAQSYREQAFKVLDPERTTIEFNSSWLAKIDAEGLRQLAAQAPESDDFSAHYPDGEPIGFGTSLYPLLQGYDSVALQADVELGGTDQKFNMLMGRHMQRAHAQKPQSILTVPLLEGLDGVDKMSKSLNNAIGLDESAEGMLKKIMSLSDSLMWRYFDLLSKRVAADIQQLKWSVGAGANLQAIKLDLAVEIAARFHSRGAVQAAREAFMAQFPQAALPNGILDIHVAAQAEGMRLGRVLMEAGLAASSAEGNRLIEQRAVWVNRQCVEDQSLVLIPGPSYLLQVGALRIARVTLRPIMSRVAGQ
jgi:tyrosyl-tRNA synthetase